MNWEAIFWLAAMVVFIFAEASTVSLVSIWFAAGALGAIAHSAGQMAMAIAITGTPGIIVYLPMMIVCSIITGLFTGLCAQLLLNRGNDLWKTFLK